MISSLVLLLGTGSLASVNAEQPFYMDKASSALVKYAVKYRASDVPEAKASEAAATLVASALAPAQATDLVQSAFSYYAVNGMKAEGTQALQLASKASSYYDALATKPAYKAYAQQAAKAKPLFNLDRAISDAQKLAEKGANKYPAPMNNAIAKANLAYVSLKSDSAGAQAIETGKQLAGRVAKDFQVDTSKVKSRLGQAKLSIVNMLYNRA